MFSVPQSATVAQVYSVDKPSKDERRYWTPVPEWIMLAGLSAQAQALYAVLLAHGNHKRGDGLVWPGMGTLAELLGFSRRQSVMKYRDELVALGVLEIIKQPGRRNNFYRIATEPPADYYGPLSFTEFYAVRANAC